MAAYSNHTQCRLVLVNRRDYRESTELSESDYADISNENATATDLLLFMRKRALEIANFIASFIRDEKLEGDVGLLGWSYGNMTTLAFLANLDGLDPDAYRILEAHFTSVILWDPPYFLFGIPKPPLAWHPLAPGLTPDEAIRAFSDWVSGYYVHGDHQYRDLDKLEYRFPNSGLNSTSAATMTKEDMEILIDRRPLAGSDFILKKSFDRCNAWPAQLHNALFGKVDYLPRTKIVHMWGSRSIWETVISPWSIKSIVNQAQQDQIRHRKLDFVELQDANHFYQWACPEAALRTFIAAL